MKSSRLKFVSDCWNTFADPWKLVVTFGGSTVPRDLGDAIDGGAERHARPQAERNRHRRQLAQVIDAVRTDGFLEADDRFERHERSARRLETELLQRVGLLLILRRRARAAPCTASAGRRSCVDHLGPSPSLSAFSICVAIQTDGRGLVAVDDEIHARALQLDVVGDFLHLGQLSRPPLREQAPIGTDRRC